MKRDSDRETDPALARQFIPIDQTCFPHFYCETQLCNLSEEVETMKQPYIFS